MKHAAAIILVAAVSAVLISCSVYNREGPNVTCAALRNGAETACSEGIIASCVGGSVRYQVCDDSKVCEAAWNAPGRYSCTEGTPPNVTDPGSIGKTCGFTVSKPTCASCISAKCCAVSQTCAADSECRSCATRSPSQSQCFPDVVPKYGAFINCVTGPCGSACGS